MNNRMTVAVLIVAATVFFSCGRKLASVDTDVTESTPVQVIDSVHGVNTEKGRVTVRMESARLEKYRVSEDESYDDFSGGFFVYCFNEEGLLETELVSKRARHTIMKNFEKWAAFGDVHIKNNIKGEEIITDTLYWDQKQKKIWTDCYVRLSSPRGMMQGYGMESDEMARNAVLLRPFDSFGIVDSTKVSYTDTVNFIGPM